VKILHVVTLVSPDGAYGGPLRVALNQAVELRRRGHEVHVAAGWRGEGRAPELLDGTPAHLFPIQHVARSRGHSGMVSLGLFRWLVANVKHFDVVHVHAGRDLISTASMAITRIRGRSYVVQTHGMVAVDERLMARLMDSLFSRRLLRAACTRFVLTKGEASDLHSVLGSGVNTERLINGVPPPSLKMEPTRVREVLYCARLHKRKRPLAFVDIARELNRRGISASYAIVGPDEGELSAVLERIRQCGLAEIVRYEGALDYGEVLNRMSRAGVYVLPSVDEPFAMSLLEALSLGIPSLCTSSCGIADILREEKAAMVTGESVVEMADGLQKILEEETLRSELSMNARRAVVDVFSMAAVGEQLERAYLDLADRQSNINGISKPEQVE
jgi:glycosyltransferase involved in cell wall biosynthesis